MTFVSDTISLKESISFKYSYKIELLEEDWKLVDNDNVYLSVAYLKGLENSYIDNISFVYTIVYLNNIPEATMYFQCIKVGDDFFAQKKIPNKIKSKLILNILKKSNGSLLLNGNFFATGVNGLNFYSKKIKPDVLLTIADRLSCIMIKNESISHLKLILFKDFWLGKDKSIQQILNKKTKCFQIDVNMVLKLKENWTSFDAYLEAMTTKYRTKAKSVYKKTADITSKEFTAYEINKNKLSIERLFNSVLNTASFNMLKLTAQSFYEFKKELGANFVFRAYFLDSKIVGFSTSCLNRRHIDANYVGIDYNINKEYPLYHRILFDYVKLAIDKQVKELRLGRTAETIKSSLGAVPEEMNLYIKHINPFLHITLSPLLRYVKPSDFTLRKPFKKENTFMLK